MTNNAASQSRLVAFALGLSLAVTLVSVRHSQAVGPLSQDLWYDDITYVVDGARRLEVAHVQGVVSFLRTFISNPPHSPLQTTLALIGLTTFGLTDDAVYFASAIVLALMTLFVVFYFRDEPSWMVRLFVVVLVTSPLAYRTISDFRPDVAGGFATAAFALLFLRGLFRNRPHDARWAALALALALLVKPSFFPHTLAVAGGVVAVWLLVRYSGRFETLAPREVLFFLGVGLGLALPYYAAHGREMLNYFWSNTRGAEGKFWNFEASESWVRIARRFALDRGYATFGFVGYTRVAVYGLVLAGCTWLAAQRRWRDLAFAGSLIGVALGSLLVISVGGQDNPFFASTFNVALLLCSFLLASECVRGAGRNRAIAVATILGASFLVAGYWNSGLKEHPRSPDVIRGRSWNEALVSAIQADATRRALTSDQVRDMNVFLTAVGGVGGPTLEWTARKAHFPAAFTDLHRSESIDELRGLARQAAYVVVPNPAKANLVSFLPAAKMQDQLGAEFLASSDFERVAAGFDGDADRYFLFVNPRRLDVGPVFGPSVVSTLGFMTEEGPYPQWGLGLVRWMVESPAKVCLAPARHAGTSMVRLGMRPAVTGRLEVRHEGRLIATTAIATSNVFQDFEVTVPNSRTPRCLEFSVPGGKAADGRLILFRSLRVEELP